MPVPPRALKSRAAPSLLSLVIPVYNEEDVLPQLRERLTAFIQAIGVAAEVILVDDGSRDATPQLLWDWSEQDPRVRIIALARNFGHQAALTAGLDAAAGEAVVVMDADLQDPPEVIGEMLREYQNGYDVVYAQRVSRQGESWLKRATAWAFYRFMRFFVHPNLPPDTGDFRLLSRPCLDALVSMRETHRFLRGMVAWAGFPQTAVPFDRPARAAGQTKYPLRKMAAFAWTAAVSFSPLPLRISLAVGCVIAVFGFCDGVYAVLRKMAGHTVPGWTSLMVAMCLIGGGILLSIGVLGEYVGRIFEEVKGRPLYIVSRRVNFPTGTTGHPLDGSQVPSHTEAAIARADAAPRRPTAAAEQTLTNAPEPL